MRKSLVTAAGLGALVLLSACGRSTLLHKGPDEFSVARQPPLVIPPDYSLTPPQPGVARANEDPASQQALEAMFGGPAKRSAVESEALNAAGNDTSDPGVRSAAGDTETRVVDKGSTTRDIVAAPAGDGQDARVTTPQ
ncbi:DUF3035 domain-containing protein [Stakelama sp. CBK3Z-3]|uniref:DUF3035 domain-containing protein n=1 Tax=Stakelama flava TaxID=2860338 RepID=A0ABS6XK84_9SPHN|nr:DUF3035 domain-containing protein [Stakelama flava]MBW4330614.1 DUF3035 domain-containing protein [Stakelama flava]